MPDVIQEIFARVFLSIHTFDAKKGEFKSWLRRLAINQCYQYYRKGKFVQLHVELESRLDWSDNIDDYRVTLEDVVIETKTNALTGETEEVRGDVEVDVEAERRVRHHNRHTLIQLPLGVGMQHQFGALNWFIQTGASVNIWGHSTGRILQPDNVYNYDGTSNKFYQNSWAINGFVETGLGLPLNHAWNLNAAIGYQKAWSNWSLENGVQMRPQIFSLQLGLAYQIK